MQRSLRQTLVRYCLHRRKRCTGIWRLRALLAIFCIEANAWPEDDEYVYPILRDRLNPGHWAKRGPHKVLEWVIERVQIILAQPEPDHIRAQADAAVRAKYPNRLG